MPTCDSGPGKKAVRDALMSQLEKYRDELPAIDTLTDTDERRSRCSSTVVPLLQSLEISTLVEHCIFFMMRSQPTESEEPG